MIRQRWSGPHAGRLRRPSALPPPLQDRPEVLLPHQLLQGSLRFLRAQRHAGLAHLPLQVQGRRLVEKGQGTQLLLRARLRGRPGPPEQRQRLEELPRVGVGAAQAEEGLVEPGVLLEGQLVQPDLLRRVPGVAVGGPAVQGGAGPARAPPRGVPVQQRRVPRRLGRPVPLLPGHLGPSPGSLLVQRVHGHHPFKEGRRRLQVPGLLLEQPEGVQRLHVPWVQRQALLQLLLRHGGFALLLQGVGVRDPGPVEARVQRHRPPQQRPGPLRVPRQRARRALDQQLTHDLHLPPMHHEAADHVAPPPGDGVALMPHTARAERDLANVHLHHGPLRPKVLKPCPTAIVLLFGVESNCKGQAPGVCVNVTLTACLWVVLEHICAVHAEVGHIIHKFGVQGHQRWEQGGFQSCVEPGLHRRHVLDPETVDLVAAAGQLGPPPALGKVGLRHCHHLSTFFFRENCPLGDVQQLFVVKYVIKVWQHPILHCIAIEVRGRPVVFSLYI
mmetsp:Transcript_36917/g.57641  ORF Transcript_36917/g.57641 Transcript_36917/m.57641 type:complete len:500 (+) Transcript_36917:421-1920(+)